MVGYPRPKVIVKKPMGPILSFPNNPIGVASEWSIIRRTPIEFPSLLERHPANVINIGGYRFREFLIDW